MFFILENILWLLLHTLLACCCCSVTRSCWTLQPHGLQCTRPPCPSPSPKVCLSSCPLHSWCHPDISSSDTLFFCPQSFPASVSFLMSQLFASDDQNTEASASPSVLPINIQGWWFPSRLTGLISLLSKGLSGVFSSTIVWRQFFGVLPSLQSSLTTLHDHWEDHSLDYTDLCWQSIDCFSTHCLGLS